MTERGEDVGSPEEFLNDQSYRLDLGETPMKDRPYLKPSATMVGGMMVLDTGGGAEEIF